MPLPMTVAYEHVKMAPKGDLPKEFVEGTLEEVMGNTGGVDGQSENEDVLEEIFGASLDE